jgi:hypothetical protein
MLARAKQRAAAPLEEPMSSLVIMKAKNVPS